MNLKDLMSCVHPRRLTLVDELVHLNGPVYFGGIPKHIAPESIVSFSGCIGDATLNGQVVDFSDTDDRPNSLLQSCDLTEEEDIVYETGMEY